MAASITASNHHPLNLSNKARSPSSPRAPPSLHSPVKYPSSPAKTLLSPPTSLTKEQQNNYSIEEAGVGPMKPLEKVEHDPALDRLGVKKKALRVASMSSGDEDDDNDHRARVKGSGGRRRSTSGGNRGRLPSGSSRRNDDDDLDDDVDDDDGGEETETAPEEAEEGEDDSITRCICDFLHDDGYMICCDSCS